jgi:hypothetical protein
MSAPPILARTKDVVKNESYARIARAARRIQEIDNERIAASDSLREITAELCSIPQETERLADTLGCIPQMIHHILQGGAINPAISIRLAHIMDNKK